uniref:homocysteine S-methyltransferase family protein n=1 Tax=Mycobacterium intracellulare TaxID=1767 RepID=UPI0019161438
AGLTLRGLVVLAEGVGQAGYIADFAEAGLVNLVGGCCGTAPPHIAEIAKVVEGNPPREVPKIEVATRLSGLEPLNITDD